MQRYPESVNHAIRGPIVLYTLSLIKVFVLYPLTFALLVFFPLRSFILLTIVVLLTASLEDGPIDENIS